MKVASTKNQTPPQQASAAAKSATRRASDGPGQTGQETAANVAAKRDFASVLDDISQAPEKRDGHNSLEAKDEAKETESRSHPSQEAETERRKRPADAAEQSSHAPGLAPSTAAMHAEPQLEATGPRSILHLADLERIVATVHTQMTPLGHREITLELTRSVLEGLRVKLSADGTGRITAEFVAANEKIRSLLDNHVQELTDLLRSRGVDLSSLKTSIGADSSGQFGQGSGNRHTASDAGESAARAPVRSSAGPIKESSANAEDDKDAAAHATKYSA